MELGGNAPFLVFEDADLDAAVEGAMLAKMRNIGEACTAANRFHVHESVADEFAAQLAERMGALKVGRGTERRRRRRPADRRRPARQGRRARRRRRRARRRVPSSAARRVDGAGYFYAPTVLADVPGRRARCSPRRSSARSPRSRRSRPRSEAIAAANDTEYGLVAYVYTRDLDRALPRDARRSRPAWSASTRASSPTPPRRSAASSSPGFGREGGFEGIDEYLETKYVAINL